MATAQRTPLSLLAESPEEQATIDKVIQSRKALEAALASREQQLFDPVLLAMAQGFLAPTKTGGFGESLGNVAATVGPAQEAQNKRAIENAQMRMELAQMEAGEAQAARGEREFNRLIGGVSPSGAAKAAPDATTGTAPQQGMRPLNESDIARLAAMPGMEGKAKILSDMVKSQRDRFKISMNGIVFDSDTQQYLDLPIPGQKQEEFTTPYGKYMMTPWQYSQYEKAEAEGKGAEWMDKFRRPGGVAKPTEQAPGRPTVGESAAAQKQREAEAEAAGKSRAGQTTQVREAGKAALSLIPTYDRMESILRTPGIDQVLGVLERGDVVSGLGSLVEEALRVGNFSVGIPAVRKLVAQTGASQDVIDAAAELGQLLAMTQFEQRKGLGSGTSVSNFEQQMVNAMGPNMTDTLRAFGKKLNFMREKAKFEHELSSALRKSKMQYEDFEDTPEFQKIFSDYQKRVTNIVYPGKKPFTVVR